MRIGLDCRVLKDTEPTGVAKYTFNLIKNILELDRTNEYVLFFDDSGLGGEWVSRLAGGQPSNYRAVFGPGVRIPFWANHKIWAQIIDQENLDLVHFPAGGVPMFLKTPYTVTVHDLAIYRHPEWFSWQPLGFWWTKRAWFKAARLIAVSQFTRGELIKLTGIQPSKIEVIYEGVVENSPSSVPLSVPAIEGDYAIFVGTLEPRKNVNNLLAAFDRLTQFAPGAKLVIAGKPGWMSTDTLEWLQSKDSSIIYLGYISDSDKYHLLRSAKFLVYPSLYEGFGLPILEAMAAGIPVITGNNSSLVEISGEAATLVDPANVSELSQAMLTLFNDAPSREDLIKKGRIQAAQFSWTKSALQTVDFFTK